MSYFWRVAPTPVGMDRGNRTRHRSAVRRSHARGDGPLQAYDSFHSAGSLPRLWGWTIMSSDAFNADTVAPTPVGMDLQNG